METKRALLTLFDIVSIVCLGVATMALFALLSELSIWIALVFGFLLLGLISIHAKKTCMENDEFFIRMRREMHGGKSNDKKRST